MATEATGVTTQLTTTAVALVTAGANESCVITSVIAMNIDTTSRIVTLYQVPAAGSATTANQMTADGLPGAKCDGAGWRCHLGCGRCTVCEG